MSSLLICNSLIQGVQPNIGWRRANLVRVKQNGGSISLLEEPRNGMEYSKYVEPKTDGNSDETAGQATGGVGHNPFGAETLRDFFKRSLGLSDPPEKFLETVDFNGIANFIQSEKCKNIITMAGAGISTSAGIPDFRSPGTGLYDNLQKYNLPSPQSVFDISYFKENPEPFFTLAKELWPGILKPTPCHYFIKMLNDKGLLLRHYTQNIDTLETQAGLDEDKIVEAHGTFRTSHCTACQKVYYQDWMEEKVMSGTIPKCTLDDCDAVVKPDIVFFGEALPKRFAECTMKDFGECDLLIIMGTSLAVQPFASLTSRVKETTPRLYINMEKTGTGTSHPVSILFFGGGFKFDDEDNYRDVFWQGTCDEGCQALADLLGWGDELKKVVKTEHAKIDKITASKKKSGNIAKPATNIPKNKEALPNPNDKKLAENKKEIKKPSPSPAKKDASKNGANYKH